MKNNIFKILLAIALIFFIGAFTTNVCAEDVFSTSISNSSNSQEGFYITNFSNPVFSSGVFSASLQVSVFTPYTYIAYNVSYLNPLSQKTHLQLYAVKSQYILSHAGKQLNGYYLYCIRKLQI